MNGPMNVKKSPQNNYHTINILRSDVLVVVNINTVVFGGRDAVHSGTYLPTLRIKTMLSSAQFQSKSANLYRNTRQSLGSLYSIFWVLRRRLNFMYRRFGTLCSKPIDGVSRNTAYITYKIEQSVPKRRCIKFRRRGITQEK
jgi:hypothetical protein